jgi:hypothetical protein
MVGSPSIIRGPGTTGVSGGATARSTSAFDLGRQERYCSQPSTQQPYLMFAH